MWSHQQDYVVKGEIGYGFRLDLGNLSNSRYAWSDGLFFNVYHDSGEPVEVRVGYVVHTRTEIGENKGMWESLKKEKYYSKEL